ncbi:hypothetical protein Agub_g8515 [Astrephomene gubernaculifera]|uniref:SET domain-containing protein n=1 Tax=Astrephomene gubernaculifera TaxID=47775 RepID=A0AAD3DRT4_9CHLO|nr:hypothetical protein Agub_g8515 [Astrephomene gubernaculifera]
MSAPAAGLLPLLLLILTASAQPVDNIDALFNWIRGLGGEVHAEVKVDSNGVRGLYATKAIATMENIAAIPSAAIINAGSFLESFSVPTLTVLREWKDPHSRFKPYIDTWPGPDAVLNSCNMAAKYAPMWKNEHWEKTALEWDSFLLSLHNGSMNVDLEYTVKEVVGNQPVSLEDLRYACAISSTRYVSTTRRKRLLMAPVFDLANHERDCDNMLSTYEGEDFLYFIAAKDLQPGDEICYSYGALRDDYAVAHYGFLPRLEDPPRLSLVDHRDFKPDVPYSHDEPPSEEPFVGTPEELRAELQRLRSIRNHITGTPDALPPQPRGQDPIYDLLKDLEARRLNAIDYEMARIEGLLRGKEEL